MRKGMKSKKTNAKRQVVRHTVHPVVRQCQFCRLWDRRKVNVPLIDKPWANCLWHRHNKLPTAIKKELPHLFTGMDMTEGGKCACFEPYKPNPKAQTEPRFRGDSLEPVVGSMNKNNEE